MSNNDLKRFLNPQYTFSAADISILEEEVKANPWFQTAYLFLAKAKFQVNTPDYNNWLNKAAVYSVSRENLFNYIYKVEVEVEVENKVEAEAEIEDEVKVEVEKNREITEAKEISIGPAKTAEGVEVKSKDDLQRIVKERLAKIEEDKIKRQEAEEQEKISIPKATGVTNKEERAAKKEKVSKPILPKGQKEIMEEFIKTEPKVSRPKDGPYDETLRLAKESLKDNMGFVSETLAEIYFKQDNHKKAIKIYEQLMLKVPEKKLYFAARIKEIVDIK